MSLFASRRVRPDGHGAFQLRLPRSERQLLAQLPQELSAALAGLDREQAPVEVLPESLKRLFPPAHPRDEQEEAAYVDLARSELVRSHRKALETLMESVSATRLSAEQLESWLGALNDLRLVLGTSLGVTEAEVNPSESDPDYPQWVCYSYLSYLLSEVVEALSGQLPPPRPDAEDDLAEDPWGEPPGGLRWDGTPTPDGP